MMDQSKLTRRGVLGAGVGLAAASAFPGLAKGRAPAAGRATGRIKNVIFLATDGMSFGTWTLAEMMRDFEGTGRGHWSKLLEDRRTVRALCKTFSANSLVTDSAAAGSAWGIGEHIDNGAVCVTPDGRTPVPILPHAAQSGKATGLVTTTRVTHATPASFAANVRSRSEEDAVAQQYIERGIDLVLGGGRRHFSNDLLSRASGYHVVNTAAELDNAPASGRLIGLFNDSHLSYTPDRSGDEPSLPTMTRHALRRLARNADGFVLQVEGGRVDHAAHANDAVSLIRDQIEFDEAVGVAMEFASSRSDTLVIVTTDHGNANPGMTLSGKDAVLGMQRMSQARHSFEWVDAQTKHGRSPIEALSEASGVEMSSAEIDTLERGILRREPVDPFGPANRRTSIMGSVLANHFAVAFVSPNHTSDYVEYTVWSPNAGSMPALVDNIDAHTQMVKALGLPPAQALR